MVLRGFAVRARPLATQFVPSQISQIRSSDSEPTWKTRETSVWAKHLLHVLVISRRHQWQCLSLKSLQVTFRLPALLMTFCWTVARDVGTLSMSIQGNKCAITSQSIHGLRIRTMTFRAHEAGACAIQGLKFRDELCRLYQ